MKIRRTALALTALLLSLSLGCGLCSCALNISANELSAGYSRRADDEGAAGEEFYSAMSALAFSLLEGSLDPDGGNTLISPFSIAMCISMIANGADGGTLSQLETLLGMDIDTLNRAMYACTMGLAGEKSPFGTANSIWFRDTGIDVEKDFLQTNADWYGAQVYSSPFDANTVKDINNWCAKYTDGMIDKIIDEIPADTLMYIINAVCFDAEWEEKYEDDDIKDKSFTNRDGTVSSVKMMMSDGETYIASDTAEGFSKSYKGGKFSFVGLLPKDENTDINEFAASLDGEEWLRMWNSRGGSVKAGIPEFSFDFSVRLNDVLEDMGVCDMFDPAKAEFSRLGKSELGNIYCSYVMHKTFIEVNRHGTRAAAITWGAMNKESAMPQYVILDRPFVCAIVDNATGLPLFVGTVTEIR